MEKIESLDCSKSASGNVPTNMLKQGKEVACNCVTDCIDNSIHDGIFPMELKKAGPFDYDLPNFRYAQSNHHVL